MESQPQNPEFRINPENFHPCNYTMIIKSDQWALMVPDGGTDRWTAPKLYPSHFFRELYHDSESAEK